MQYYEYISLFRNFVKYFIFRLFFMEKKGIILDQHIDCILIDTLSFINLVQIHEAQNRITIVIIYQHCYKWWKHFGEKKNFTVLD